MTPTQSARANPPAAKLPTTRAASPKASFAEVHVFPQRLGRPDDFSKLVVAMVENPLLNGDVVRLDAAARMGPPVADRSGVTQGPCLGSAGSAKR
jgi:hypothetical protein